MHDTDSAPDNAALSGKRQRRHPRGVFERPKRSGIWWVRYTDQHGREHREKVGPKKLASDVYQKRKTAVREGRFFPDQLRPLDPIFADHATDYLARKRSALRDPAGAERYARWFREAPETRGKAMRQITSRDFERYRDRRLLGGAIGAKRRRGPASPTTVNKELSFARAVFNDFIDGLEERDVPPIANPVRRRLFASETAHRTRYLSAEEEDRLRDAFPPDAWPIVLVALKTGLDRGAELGLRWSQVDLATRTIHAARWKGGHRTDPVLVNVKINDSLLAVLRVLPSRGRSAWLFPNANNTGPLNGREFDRLVFRPALAAAGIPDFRWKDLRHTFATRLRAKGVDTGSIRELLGHTTERMTQRYAHAAPGLLLAAVQRLDETADATGTATGTGAAHQPRRRPKAAR